MEIITFNSLPNTNDFLMELSKKDANSWTVIHALNQTQGKGYAGNEWKVEANENLTFSLLIKSALDYKDLIALNEWVAYCIYLTLTQYTRGIAIKWPNDIILNDKKVCGVLIQNYKSNNTMHSVIGIGINVNQTDFNQFPKASSLANETDKTYDIVSILTDLLQIMQRNFHLILEQKFDEIHTTYNSLLYRKGQQSKFRIQNELHWGEIIETTKHGSLVVEIEGEQKEFLHKQIELIF